MIKDIDVRDKLAQERTILANERTLLAYIRTSFTSFITGLALLEFFKEYTLSTYLGGLAILIGFFFSFIGIKRYLYRNKKIKEI